MLPNFIDYDSLVKCKACKKGLDFFKARYPQGASLMTILKDPIVPKKFIVWGEDHFLLTPEEEAARIKALDIVNSSEVYKSYDVANSNFIYSSKHIHDSSDVIQGAGIKNSQSVSSSENVNDSKKIVMSHNIESCFEVRSSSFVSNSANIFWSKNIENSSNIMFSIGVYDSFCVSVSKNVVNCYFCSGVIDLTNAVFCDATCTQNGEFMCFNQPITERQFDSIVKNLRRYYTGWNGVEGEREFVHELAYTNISDTLKDYIKTLPGYDPYITDEILLTKI